MSEVHEYFEAKTDEELLEIVDGYRLEAIPYEHPLREAAHDIFGKEDVVSLLGVAVPLLLVISERLKQSKYE